MCARSKTHDSRSLAYRFVEQRDSLKLTCPNSGTVGHSQQKTNIDAKNAGVLLMCDRKHLITIVSTSFSSLITTSPFTWHRIQHKSRQQQHHYYHHRRRIDKVLRFTVMQCVCVCVMHLMQIVSIELLICGIYAQCLDAQARQKAFDVATVLSLSLCLSLGLPIIRFIMAISILLTMMYCILIVRWLERPMSMTGSISNNLRSPVSSAQCKDPVMAIVIIIYFSLCSENHSLSFSQVFCFFLKSL